jgi:hypothetical protein
MQVTKLASLCALVCGALSAAPSHAVEVLEVGWGTYVGSGTAGNCPSFCTGGEFANQSGGGDGQAFASASESTYATSRGSAAFAPAGSYLPLLKAYSSAGVGKRATTNSFASQLFTYTGAASITVDLAVNLTGSVQVAANGSYTSSGIDASVAVVRGASLPWFPSFGTLVYEFVSEQDRLAVDSVFINTPGVTSDSVNLLFTLMPGESFYVISQLNASSNNGVADAENTLTMAFDAASTGFMLAASPVPELGTAWMASLGLLALVVGAQRRRSAA